MTNPLGAVLPIRLMIADDDAELRQSALLMVSLESDIAVVSVARDGQEALSLAQQHRPDVAVIDLHMPRLDGLATIQGLARALPGTICIAMSYDGERHMLRQAMAAGAREYLIKPFSGDELVSAVRRVAGRPLDPPARVGRSTTPLGDRARQQDLVTKAIGYLRAGRSDGEAAEVYAELVRLPNLDMNTLTRLAEIFLGRRDWATLRLLAERLEKLSGSPPPKTGPFAK